jgi:ribonuclease J
VVRDSDVPGLAPSEVLCVATGSQGEPQSALSRIAIDDHRHIKIGSGDTVVFSARAIPGNEKAIGRVVNHVTRRGADVITEEIKHVHVSGHGSEEELKLVLSLVRPRYFIPIHGEYRQLAHHRRIAQRVSGAATPGSVLLAENGDVIRLTASTASIEGKAETGRVLIDGTRVGEVGDEVLRDRRHLAEDGLALPVIAITKRDGALAGAPEIMTRGFVTGPGDETLLVDGAHLLADVISSTSLEERTDPGLLREKIRLELRRFFRKRSGRRPLVLPVIMEI